MDDNPHDIQLDDVDVAFLENELLDFLMANWAQDVIIWGAFLRYQVNILRVYL